MLVYRCEDLIPIGYTDSNFQLDLGFRKSTLGCVFMLGSGAISWKVLSNLVLLTRPWKLNMLLLVK